MQPVRLMKRRGFLLGLAAAPIATACDAQRLSEVMEIIGGRQSTKAKETQRFPENLKTRLLVHSARQQIGVTIDYDPAYVSLKYPGGDFDRSRGVCTDVIIRAYRDAIDFDLQKAIHEDMLANFAAYPKIWDLSKPDRNIDHRRVPNIERFLERGGYELPATEWRPGDLITCRVGKLPHIGIVSYSSARDGTPKVIHNIGRGTREETVIGYYNNERRFRFFPAV